jgi:transcription antitermination factor NusG
MAIVYFGVSLGCTWGFHGVLGLIIRDAANLAWYVIKARHKREAACAQVLMDKGLTVFLPMVTKTVRNGLRGPRISKQFPMCPPYLFIGFHPGQENWGPVMTCRRLVSELIADAYGTPRAASTLQMVQFIGRASDASVASSKRQQRPFQPGDTAQVIAGAWQGRTIQLTEVKGRTATFIAPLFGADMPVKIAIEELDVA